jgi:hypothetical protein
LGDAAKAMTAPSSSDAEGHTVMEIPTVSAMSMRTVNTSRWVASARANRTTTSASERPTGQKVEYESSAGAEPTAASAHNAMTLATVQAAYASI